MALTEAIADLQRGLDELPKLALQDERERLELDMRVALGAAWMGLGGWFNPNVPLALEPAWVLARKHRRRDLLAPLCWGLAMHLATTGRIADSLVWMEESIDQEDLSASADLRIVREMTNCVCRFWHGDLLAAKMSVDNVLAAYRFEDHGHIAILTNHDPKTLVSIYRANLLWLLGYPDQALAATRELDQIACERGHYFDQGFAWTLGGWAYVYCGMPDEFERFLKQAYRVGVEQGLAFLPMFRCRFTVATSYLNGRCIAKPQKPVRRARRIGSPLVAVSLCPTRLRIGRLRTVVSVKSIEGWTLSNAE